MTAPTRSIARRLLPPALIAGLLLSGTALAATSRPEKHVIPIDRILVIVNDDVNLAYAHLEGIILAERSRRIRKAVVAETLLRKGSL